MRRHAIVLTQYASMSAVNDSVGSMDAAVSLTSHCCCCCCWWWWLLQWRSACAVHRYAPQDNSTICISIEMAASQTWNVHHFCHIFRIWWSGDAGPRG